jgi:selenocysteine lyase/cysteine desulfurase
MFNTNRRDFFIGIATASVATSTTVNAQSLNNASSAFNLPITPNDNIATQQHYWKAVRNLYSISGQNINLENGYWGIMAEPVRLDYVAKTEMVNKENSFYARTQFGKDAESARSQLAKALGAETSEIALTRGATEALQLLIAGYNKLKAGDTVIYSDLDYDSMQYGMKWLADRRGVNVVKFNVPEPATKANVLAAYQKILNDHPKAALLLLTHVSHRTGLVMPVPEIAAMAKSRGVAVILDAAHSWGQIDFKVSELGVDFVGFNLHKWIGAPLGLGFMYISKSKLTEIDRAMGDEDYPSTDIRSRVHTGTVNFASILTLPTALKLHNEIGAKAKELRVKHLRNYWVSRARELKGLQILTPDEAGMYAGITSFRMTGKGTAEENNAIVAELRDKHGIFSVRRAGVANGQCIRISPAVYSTELELDRLVDALKNIVFES